MRVVLKIAVKRTLLSKLMNVLLLLLLSLLLLWWWWFSTVYCIEKWLSICIWSRRSLENVTNWSKCFICGQEAIAAESYLESVPMCIQKGDLETGFAESDHVLEGEMRVGGQVRLNWSQERFSRNCGHFMCFQLTFLLFYTRSAKRTLWTCQVTYSAICRGSTCIWKIQL